MRNRIFKFLFGLLVAVVNVVSVKAGSTYNLEIGSMLKLDVPSVSLGYVDKAIWACSNPAIEFVDKSNFSATITATDYFEGYAIVELVYVEKYVDYKGFTRANTYTKNYYISCQGNNSNDGTTGMAKSISVEPEIRVAIGEDAKIQYQLYPEGSVAELYCGNRPGSYFNSLTINKNESCVHGWARSVGVETVTVYFYNEKGETISASCNVTVYDPAWVAPESLSMQPVLLMLKGENKKVLPTLYPSTATTLYSWKSDNTSIVRVSNGEISAKNTGTAIVTVETSNGLMAKCNVIVVDEQPQAGVNSALNRAAEMLRTVENDIIH